MERVANQHLLSKNGFRLEKPWDFHNMPVVASSRKSRKEKLVRRVSIALSLGLLVLTALMLVAQHHR